MTDGATQPLTSGGRLALWAYVADGGRALIAGLDLNAVRLSSLIHP